MSDTYTKDIPSQTGSAGEPKRSYFDGTTWQRIGWGLLGGLITLLTLGIAYPWAMCMMERWKARHTVINGRRLKFTGKGIGLWGRYLLWCLLTVLTFGIYSIWMGLGIKKWQVRHTFYADDDTPVESKFTGGAGGWFGNRLLCVFVSVITLGIAFPWMYKRLLKWEAGHTRIGGSPLVFSGTGGQLLGKYLLLLLLSVLTLGIYTIFFPVSFLKWLCANTQALSCTTKYRQRSRSHEEQAQKDYTRFRLADNDAQLERMKSGVTEEATEEELLALTEEGNRSAMYELALRRKGESWEADALDHLRSSALLNWHPAMLDYAKTISAEQTALYAELLTGSAVNGNPEAPWLLKEHYEAYAYKLHQEGSYDSAEQLQKAAYWFYIAMEHGHGQALQSRADYEKMVETVALWLTERREPERGKAKGGAVFLTVSIILAVIFTAALCVHLYFEDAAPSEAQRPAVMLMSEGMVIGEDTPLFERIPWGPGVVSFENFQLINGSTETATLRLALNASDCQEELMAILLIGPVSEGDLERVMAQKDRFVSVAEFSQAVSAEPGQTVKFAVILYWPGADTPAEPQQVDIFAMQTLE